jgi:hypothetical protein
MSSKKWLPRKEDTDRNWSVTAEQLKLFVQYKISIPPKMAEVASVLERLYWEEKLDGALK